jgi:hypothetical protein
MKRLERTVPPTAEEQEHWPNYPGQRKYEKYVRFSTIEAVKAGWLAKRSGIWTITELGRAALDQFQDPYEFQREATRRYRLWRALRAEATANDDSFARIWPEDSETEEDVAASAENIAGGSVLAATDWTAETIINQLKRGNIDLNPSFQRRDAWRTPERKSRFIESVILGLPIPQIVLAESKDRRGSFVVIDGKQRLLALRQFAADPDDDFTPLVLAGLDIRPDLNGLSLADMKADPARGDDLAAFENQTIRTVVVRQWPNENYLFVVFLRLNTGSVPLAPQELRQALHPGPFMDFADEFAENSEIIHDALGVEQPDFRMRDVELLIRFIAFGRYLDTYAGNLKEFLDLACLRLNERWATESGSIEEEATGCELAIAATIRVFGNGAFRRWTGEHWERTFNRAVFDAETFYFRDAEIAQRASGQSAEVVRAFQDLSVGSVAFSQSVQTSTKTVSATYERLSAWGAALSGVLGVELPIPRLEGNRIRYI